MMHHHPNGDDAPLQQQADPQLGQPDADAVHGKRWRCPAILTKLWD
jgi:hypothetical protein